jgi:antitoxin component YwqK of YwqJK toxin-antitoxin module
MTTASRHICFLLFGLFSLFMTGCDNSKTVTDDWSDGRKVVKVYANYSDTLTYERTFYYANGQLGTKGNYANGKMQGVSRPKIGLHINV